MLFVMVILMSYSNMKADNGLEATSLTNNSSEESANKSTFSKASIQSYAQSFKEEDVNDGAIYCYAFAQYDNANALIMIGRFMQNQDILKFCPTKNTFAIKTNSVFNKAVVQEIATQLGLTVQEIDLKQYKESILQNK